MLRIFIVICFLCLATLSGWSQGAWHPANADTSRPRVLLSRNRRLEVRELIKTNPRLQNIYAGIYFSAFHYDVPNIDDIGNQNIRNAAAANAAFVSFIGLGFDTLSQLIELPLSVHTQLRQAAINVIKTKDTNVPKITLSDLQAYDSWQWKSKHLTHLLVAYDLLKAMDLPESDLAPARENLTLFVKNFHDAATYEVFQGFGFFDIAVNNHAIMTGGSIGLAAVVLNESESADPNGQAAVWFNTALFQTDRVLFRDTINRQSERGKLLGYAESPYYFKYGFYNYLPFINALGRYLPDGQFKVGYKTDSVSVPHPFFDPDIRRLAEWIDLIRMPDGRIPPLDDSFMTQSAELLVQLNVPGYHWPVYYDRRSPQQSKEDNDELNSAFDIRAMYLSSYMDYDDNQDDSLFQALAESGNLVMRSGWDKDALYLHVTAEHGIPRTSSQGHNHGDASSYMLYAYGELMALDAAYVRYNVREQYGQPTNHNLVLVDGCGPVIGQPFSSNDADAYIDQPVDLPLTDYARVKTNYCGAKIERRFAMVNKNFVVVADDIKADTTHQYTNQLHGFGEIDGSFWRGQFYDGRFSGQGRWQKNGVTLQGQMTATNGLDDLRVEQSRHELTLAVPDTHAVLLADKKNARQTSFLTVLYPYKTVDSPPLVQVVSETDLAAIRIERDIFAMTQNDTFVQKLTPSQTRLAEIIATDARFTIAQLDSVGKFRQLFLQDGTGFYFGEKQFASAEPRQTFGLQRTSETEFYGFAEKKGQLVFRLIQKPFNVTGENLTDWQYEETAKTLTLNFSGQSYFKLQTIFTPISTTGIDEDGLPQLFYKISPNPATDRLYLRFFADANESLKFTLTDLQGRILSERNFLSPVSDFTDFVFPLSDLPQGVYLLKGQRGGKLLPVKKVVVR